MRNVAILDIYEMPALCSVGTPRRVARPHSAPMQYTKSYMTPNQLFLSRTSGPTWTNRSSLNHAESKMRTGNVIVGDRIAAY